MLQILQFIWEFLQWCYFVLVQVVRFLVDSVLDLAYTVQLCGEILSTIPTYFYWLPGNILSILLIIFGIVVVYKFIGREG